MHKNQKHIWEIKNIYEKREYKKILYLILYNAEKEEEEKEEEERKHSENFSYKILTNFFENFFE